ncbi:MAG TPA: precorrin-8X methylmutase, partial [Stellaceae bacterium]|nr:precorrin-8X methylmutase [Stellaceae bacterium]
LGADSIWVAALRRQRRGAEPVLLENLATRRNAAAVLRGFFIGAVARGERVLAGFDFPFGYPAGLARRLGLSGSPWRAVWDEISALLVDGPDNRNNRFEAAADLNRRLTGEAFPFWCCPAGAAGRFLQPKHHRRHSADGFPEHRLVDRRMRGPQPGWKLAGTGSAGGQALTGIPVLRALRADPALREHLRVWPFETGLAAPAGRRHAGVIMAEIYPSLVPAPRRSGEVKDSAQVRHLAAHFAALDARGKLAALLAGDPALSAAERRRVEREEGWVLGVAGEIARRARDPSRARSIPLRLSGVERQGEVGQRRGIGKETRRVNRAIAAASTTPHRVLDKRPTSPSRSAPEGRSGTTKGPGQTSGGAKRYRYLKDPAAIYRRSFALIRREVDLRAIPRWLWPLALRLVHASGEPDLLKDLRWSDDAQTRAKSSLASDAPIFVDSEMVAAGIQRRERVRCLLNDGRVPRVARKLGTTRSAAAVELWRPELAGAVVAIGNAPTALYHLLEMIAAGAPPPALILGFPVGFVGAAESKQALADNPLGLAYVTLLGRRGGSALAAAAVNALMEPAR